ncbi:AEC family transporter [Clostridium transplantifaecale]|uniref:AEC family transporter n=1 Tax=Clostridium transplantifaecale TaxID=2479838 RepID=UPI000F63C413|nr:AEC family transporter [Clostridium transplantifaecale]
MESAVVILRQIMIMFVYMVSGYLMFHYKLITKEGSRSLANLLLYVSLPCVIVKSFCVQNTAEIRNEVLLSLLMGLAILLVSMAVAGLLFRKRPMENFAAAFSNAGFMGIPLIAATVGERGVLYTAGMIALLNVFQWTYGQWLLAGRTGGKQWKGLCNPLTVSLVIGLLVFLGRITPPDMAISCLTTLSGLNGPLAMIVLGVYLAQTKLTQLFCRGESYMVCIVRLLLIPLLTIGLLCLVPKQLLTMKQALLIAACSPIGSNVAVYAQKLDSDYTYAVQLVCLSTLLGIISMPIIMGISSLIWQ